MADALLELRNVSRSFVTGRGLFARRREVRALRDVTLSVYRGEALGLVGESGSGKTTLALTSLRLIEPDTGEIVLDGVDLLRLGRRYLRQMRRRMQMVFQDPLGSLNPRMRVGETVREPLRVHGMAGGRELDRVAELFAEVGLGTDLIDRYPHELSGGQRQRVGIARALAVDPDLLILDEPVSALDVSVQAQVLNLLLRLRRERGLTYLFVSHDLAVVRQICDRVAVMYLGEIVEQARADTIFDRPRHPYTRALLSAVPEPDPVRKRGRIVLGGDPPDPADPPRGCPFHPRCPHPSRDTRCVSEKPALREVRESISACHYAEQPMT